MPQAWTVTDNSPVPNGSVVAFYDGAGKVRYGRRVPGGTSDPHEILVEATLGRGFGRRRATIAIKLPKRLNR